MRSFSVALLSALAIVAIAVPVKADEVSRAPQAQAKRAPSSAGTTVVPSLLNGIAAPSHGSAGFANGFVYAPGPQPAVNVGGRLKVGKTGVYVPYYGNLNADPAHPTWQGAMGLAYGFRTWDISVINGGFGNAQTVLPGVDAPKVNPNLSLSIRF